MITSTLGAQNSDGSITIKLTSLMIERILRNECCITRDQGTGTLSTEKNTKKFNIFKTIIKAVRRCKECYAKASMYFYDLMPTLFYHNTNLCVVILVNIDSYKKAFLMKIERDWGIKNVQSSELRGDFQQT